MATSAFRASSSSGRRRSRQTFQDEDLAARQQGRVQLERGVFRGRADQDHRAVLDIRQEAVLLGPVEAVDLVDEQQRALPHAAPFAGPLENLAQVGHAREHGRERLEGEPADVRQQAGDRRLAGPRRPPENHRGEPAGRDHATDRRLGRQQVVLSYHLAQARRPQAVGQRPRRLAFEQRRRHASYLQAARIPGHERNQYGLWRRGRKAC
jgi:hypothetical protein